MRKSVMISSAAFMLVAATSAEASTRYYAYDADNRLTQSLTRGITLEVERGMFGATRAKGLYATSSRGSARFIEGGPSAMRAVLPENARNDTAYSIDPEGDGRALGNALCPGSQTAWLVTGRVRSGHPLTINAVGVWPDGVYRHCAELKYRYRGEWAALPNKLGEGPSDR